MIEFIQEQIEQRVRDQNWRVVDNVLNIEDCCEWAHHRFFYDRITSFFLKKAHHKALGSLRPCYNCWVCFRYGMIPDEVNRPRSCEAIQTHRTPKLDNRACNAVGKTVNAVGKTVAPRRRDIQEIWIR